MSRGDVLVRMKADTSSYNAGIASANKTLAQFKQANLTMGGIISQLTKSLTAAAAGYMSVAAAGSAITGLIKESVELAKAGEGIRLAFQRLNRPDLLDGLRQATHNTITDIDLMKAAVRFDDFKLSLDDMGTMLAFAQQKAKDTGQSVDYMVESITMGLGRQSKQILDNLGISASEITERMKSTGDMTKAVAEIIREQMSKAGDYVETASERATQAEVALKNEMDRLGQVFAPLTESANSFFSAVQIGAIQALTAIGRMINSLSSAGRAMNAFTGGGDASVQKGLGKLRVAKAAGSSYMVNSLYNDQVADYNRRINDYDAQIKNGGKSPGAGSGESRDIRWLQAQRDGLVIARDQYIQQAKQIMTPIVNKTTVDTGGTAGSGGGGKGFNIASIAFSAMSDSSMKYDPSQHAQASGLRPENILGPSDEWENYKNVITDSIGGIADEMNNLSFDNFQESYEKVGKDVDKLIKSSKASYQAMSLAASAANSLGSAFGNMEDPGAKAAGMVVSAIASIALGFAQAAAAKDTVASGWAWLLWVVAGLSAMATSIATVHNLTGFAQGGIVGGNQYSGDNIYAGNAMVNSGELVLNKAQQGNLASQLQGNGINNMNISGRIKGTDIILSVDRSLQLQGKQLLTWG